MFFMNEIVVTVTIVFCMGIVCIKGQDKDETCEHTRSGQKGICRPIKECQDELVNIQRGLFPQQCGFEGFEAIVCCVHSSVPKLSDAPALAREIGNIARQKCKEYSKHVYKTVLNPTLLAGASDVTISQCFVEEVTIFDDKLVKRKEFPHLAIIGYGKTKYTNLDWLCVGSLISEKHVLTSAHCTVSKSGPPQKVRLGTVNLELMDENGQLIGIDKFTNHPSYRKQTNDHDVSILFLERNVKFSAFVRPACLSKLEEVLPSIVIATGFDNINENEYNENSIVQKSAWNYIPKERCIQHAQLFESPNTITDKVLCAKHSKYQGKCQDSSNEMLQVFFKEPYCMYGIVGITSYGESCSVPNLPSFTKLDQYITWIESTIWF